MFKIQALGVNESINLLLVFFEGVISFFSPCVIPIIPLYMGYLAGGAKTVKEDGTTEYNRKNILIHTVFFILGISSAFFILGLGFSILGMLLKSYGSIVSKVSGILIIILGLNQLGLFKIGFLNKEVRINKQVNSKKMNPIVAFIMGFGFSFAWTPCVGPGLASVLLLASNANSALVGNLYVLLYSVGFLIPFIVLGIFTGQTLTFIKKNPKIMEGIVKVGGVILVAIGLMLFLGTFSKFESLFNPSTTSTVETKKEDESSQKTEDKVSEETENKDEEKTSEEKTSEEEKKEDSSENNKPKIKNIVLKDQNGNTVDIEKDFKGKVVFLNFFATWCPPCKAEIPDIQKIFEEKGYNKNEVVILAVASPSQGREQDIEGVKQFIKDYKITYPVLMDTTGEVFTQYGVYSLPTTFLINKESRIYGYITGGIPKDKMEQAIRDTLEDKAIQ